MLCCIIGGVLCSLSGERKCDIFHLLFGRNIHKILKVEDFTNISLLAQLLVLFLHQQSVEIGPVILIHISMRVSSNICISYFSFKSFQVSFKRSLLPKMNLNTCIKKEPATTGDNEFEVNCYVINMIRLLITSVCLNFFLILWLSSIFI